MVTSVVPNDYLNYQKLLNKLLSATKNKQARVVFVI